jgi:hypothetical protein
MPPPYLSPQEILAMQRVLPLYAGMPESRYPEIEQAEQFNENGNAIFEKLSDEFYRSKYGTSESERFLTYAG